MSKFATSIVQNIQPYTPGEQSAERLIKLNTNENPNKISMQIKIAMSDEFENLHLYPDPESTKLKQAIADYYNINAKQVFVGNGSDEVLAHIFQAFFANADLPLLMPDITYSFYTVYANLYNTPIKQIALNTDFCINISHYTGKGVGIILPNPNAPTGILLELDDIKTLIENNQDKLIVIDEAYIDFAEGEKSALAFINKYDNLIITQTFSKSRSLAGLRIGFAMANTALIDDLNKVKNSFNSYPVDRLAEAAASSIITDRHGFDTKITEIINTRKYLVENLNTLEFTTLPSHANFVFTKHKRISGEKLQKLLRDKKILVRNFSQPERIKNYLRISIGSKKDIDMLIIALKQIISN